MDSDSTADESGIGTGFLGVQRSGLLALVFTDIVGSTQIKETLGDREGVALIQQHHALIRETLAGFPEAQEISTAGDSFLIALSKPSEAVRFALLVQSRLRQLKGKTPISVQDRIGIHVGEVMIEEGGSARKFEDLHGIQLDTCARVMSLAAAGQILMTRAVFDNARQVLKGQASEGLGQLSWISHGPYLLKGIEEPFEICEVVEVGQRAASAPITSEKAQRHIREDREEVLGWRPAVEGIVPGTKWVLERQLGEGGFGEVWLGRHQTMKERRVFKFCFRKDRVRSLKREMTLFRLLRDRVGEHPNIVSLREVYFDEPPYYVEMDYVEGNDLRGWCEQLGGAQNLPLETRLEIVAQVADALAAAHEAGVIHRDIKPANILISNLKTPGSNPNSILARLTDFGIGQVMSAELLAGITRLGFTQTMLSSGTSSQTGTQLYMAPELLAGEPASTGSDIYSLGVVLYQLLLGNLSKPLTTDWRKQIQDPFLRDDLERCFAGNPEERFGSATIFAANLRSLGLRHAEEAARLAAIRRRRLRLAAMTAALLVASAAGAIGVRSWWNSRSGENVIRNFGKVYANARTYQDQTEIRQELAAGGARQNIEYASSVYFARPNKINITLKTGSQEMRVVCDGQRLWILYSLGPISQYKEKEAPKSLEGVIEREFEEDALTWGTPFAINLYRIITEDRPDVKFAARARQVKLVGAEAVGGKGAFLLEWEDSDPFPKAVLSEGETNTTRYASPIKSWVSKKNGLVLKYSKDITQIGSVVNDTLSGGDSASPSITRFVVTETHTEVKLNAPIAEQTFHFKPPAESTRVDQFTIFRKLARLPEKPASPRTKEELARLILARDQRAKAELIDLSDYYNESLTGFVTEPNEDNTLASVPRGLQRMAGIDFDVRGMIYLTSRRTKLFGSFPNQVSGIKVGRKTPRLHFLHCSHAAKASEGATIAKYVLHYANGEHRELPVRYGLEVVDWWRKGNAVPPGLTVAWHGSNKASATEGASIQLFKSTWDNPLPEQVIETIDFVSAMLSPSPFLIAITVE